MFVAGMTLRMTFGKVSSSLDDNFSFFSLKRRSWVMCVLVMKFMKWLSCPGATYIWVYCVVGTTAPWSWRSWWCLEMSNLYRVRSGIHFFSILKLILSDRIERICRRMLQWPALLKHSVRDSRSVTSAWSLVSSRSSHAFDDNKASHRRGVDGLARFPDVMTFSPFFGEMPRCF